MIRKATYHDMPELMEVFSRAREIMRASGNMNQWNKEFAMYYVVPSRARMKALARKARKGS